MSGHDEVHDEVVAKLAVGEETLLEAKELAAKRRAAKRAGDGPGWTTQRAKPGEKRPPDIWPVEQPDGTYKPVGRSGKWHVMYGASGAAKTFLAAGLVAPSLRRREPVYWADFEDQGEDLPDMLRAFGVHNLDDLHLFTPEAPPDAAGLIAYCQGNGIKTVVMDAQRGAIRNAVPGDYGSSGTDVELFSAQLVRPLTKAGVTVLTIDHIAKTASGGMPIGSERKLSAADIAFEVEAVEEIHEDAGLGYSRVIIRKYRGGAFRKGTVPAHLVYRSGRATLELQPAKPSLSEFATQHPNGTVNRDLERAAAIVAWVTEHQHEVPTGARTVDALMSGRPDLFPSLSTTKDALKFARDTGRVVAKRTGNGRELSYELPEAAACAVSPDQLQHEGEAESQV